MKKQCYLNIISIDSATEMCYSVTVIKAKYNNRTFYTLIQK